MILYKVYHSVIIAGYDDLIASITANWQQLEQFVKLVFRFIFDQDDCFYNWLHGWFSKSHDSQSHEIEKNFRRYEAFLP
jgi:hypothetical protein